MATHRRGLRPAQWPVRDLLGAQRDRMGALRDPRLYAAVSGLLACGAAATVVFTASDGVAGRDAGTGPMALPAPNNAVPAPAEPAPSDPAPPDPARSQPGRGSGSGPVPRAWQLPPDDRPPTVAVPMPADGAARSASVREIADRVAAELVRLQAEPSSDGTALLVVPSQRGGDVTALVKRVPRNPPSAAAPKRAAGRHRAEATGGTGDREQPGARAHDRGQRDERDRDEHDRDERDRDERDREDRKGDRDEDRKKHDRDEDRKKHDRDEDRKHDRDDDREHDRDEDDRRHDRDDDRKHDHDEHDRKHDCDEHDQDEDRERDRDDRDDDHDHDRHPAMAVLGTPADDDRDERLGGRTIESDALVAALDGLEGETPFRGWFAA